MAHKVNTKAAHKQVVTKPTFMVLLGNTKALTKRHNQRHTHHTYQHNLFNLYALGDINEQ
jgi:hypothetical protein